MRRAEGPGDLVVAQRRVGVGRHDGDRGHVGAQAEHGQRGQEKHPEGGQPGCEWMAPKQASPRVQAVVEVAGLCRRSAPDQPAGVDTGTQPGEDGREEGQGGCQHRCDGQDDTQGRAAKRRARDQQDGRQRRDYRQGAEGDRFAGGVERLGHRRHHAGLITGLHPSALQGSAEAHYEEEGVIDTEGQGEHQGEIEGPDRHGRYLGGEHQGAGRHHKADQGEHEGQAGGDKAAEGDHQDDHRHRPGQHLRTQHGAAVDCVEVGPKGAGPGQGDGDARA